MKILYPILSFYPSQSGGPSNSVYWLTKALQANGVMCSISTTDEGISKKHNIKLNKWIEKDYGVVKYQKNLFRYFPFRTLFTTLSQVKSIDLIHFSSIFYPLTWLTIIWNKLFWNKTIILSPRGELDPEALIYSPVRKKVVLSLYKALLLKNITFHATCKEESNFIKATFGKNVPIIIIPNLMPLVPKSNIINKEKYLLYLGRIHPIKAIENLIKSIPLSISFKENKFKLLVVGKGDVSYELQLKTLVDELNLKDKIQFIGHIEGKYKEQLLANAKALIMPSHTENFGNVVIEALQFNTPVIASKGAPWKILEDYNAGYWIENDKKNLASSIDNMIDLAPENYKQMCLNARKLVEKEFDVENNIHRWIDIYQNLISGQKEK